MKKNKLREALFHNTYPLDSLDAAGVWRESSRFWMLLTFLQAKVMVRSLVTLSSLVSNSLLTFSQPLGLCPFIIFIALLWTISWS